VVATREADGVLEGLRELDDVGYLRFANVYKGFERADEYAREAVVLTKVAAPNNHEHAHRP
jgi:transcriptional repressor NrdR